MEGMSEEEARTRFLEQDDSEDEDQTEWVGNLVETSEIETRNIEDEGVEQYNSDEDDPLLKEYQKISREIYGSRGGGGGD